jgi:hypothetical protein
MVWELRAAARSPSPAGRPKNAANSPPLKNRNDRHRRGGHGEKGKGGNNDSAAIESKDEQKAKA